MTRDFRDAARALLRTPLFTCTATLALALAIGANAAIFGLVDALWFRPAGVRNPSTLVRVFATTSTEPKASWSFPEYIEIRDGVRTFDGVVARGRRGAMLPSADGSPELVLVNVVSANFFTALGVNALHGRIFTEADQRTPAATAVLGHAFWQTRFGADPSLVGRTIPLGRAGSIPVTVLGVLPPAFRELDAAVDRDVWLPPFTWQQLSGENEFEDRTSRWFEVFARLRPGGSAAAAQAETSILAAAAAERFPATNAGRGVRVVTDLDHRLESGGATATALLALVLLVIAITCVNVANLLLARAEGRAGELALRSALGAERWRITRQLLAECILLGALGCVAGLAVGAWLIRLLPAIMGAPPGFRSFLVFETDARVIVFTLGTTIVTTLLFGIAPSLMATRTDVGSIIKGGAGLTGSGRSGGAFRHALVVTQIAVSVVLLCAAGVLVRSFARTQSADLGFARAPVLTAWGANDVPRDTALQAVRQLEALPGVGSVAVAIRAPLSLSGGGMAQPVFLPHAAAEPGSGLPSVKFNAVSSNYFSTVGTRILRGRGFNDLDQHGSIPAIIVNERFAAQFFPGRDPLQGVIRLGGPTGADRRIVGIAQNAAINAIGEAAEAYFYLPYWSQPHGEITFFVATTGDAARLALPVRDALRRLDARLEPRRLITMREYIDHSARVYQTTALLASSLGTIGLVLTALGVYGVIAYRMMRRSRELAVRVAVGASPSQLLSLLLREGCRVLLLGVAIGIPAALAATRRMTSLLFGIAPWDAPAFLAAAGLLLLVVGTAVVVPARRASRVNPAALLRS
jgi:predicted permease